MHASTVLNSALDSAASLGHASFEPRLREIPAAEAPTTAAALSYWSKWLEYPGIKSVANDAAAVLSAEPFRKTDSVLDLRGLLIEMSFSAEGRQALDDALPILSHIPSRTRDAMRIDAADLGTVSTLSRSGFLYVLFSAAQRIEEDSRYFMTRRLETVVKVEQLKVLSYNVAGLPAWLGGEPVTASCEPGDRRDRFRQIGLAIRAGGFDLVGLQEMFAPQTERIAASSEIRFAAGSGTAHGTWGIFGASGLVTLSRHPIIRSEFRAFTATIGIERFVGKGAQFAEIERPDGTRVRAVNVHTISPTIFIPDRTARRIRVEQLRELGAWLEEMREPGVEEIIMGDFNLHLDEISPDIVPGTDLYRRRHPVDALSCESSEARNGYTFDIDRNRRAQQFWARERGSGSKRFDGVFANDAALDDCTAISAKLEFDGPGKQLSDHFGVGIDLITATG